MRPSRISRDINQEGPFGLWGGRLVWAAGIAAFALVLFSLFVREPGRLGLLLLLLAAGTSAIVVGLRSPMVASIYLLLTTFFRLAIPTGTLPVDPFILAFGGVVLSVGIRLWAHPVALEFPYPVDRQRTGIGAIECTMALYIAWNFYSMIAPHLYSTEEPLDPGQFSVLRFVLIGTVMPFTMFLVARYVFTKEPVIRYLLWTVMAATAYSAAVSILQFNGPAVLVWPRYIMSNPNWPGRAVGVFDQPVVNGLVLIVGYLVAVLIASHRNETTGLRIIAVVLAIASVYSIYLTHTRAVWLSFVLVISIGALCASGLRRAFTGTLAAISVAVMTNWSTLTSADRSAGGVGSPSEVEDRLNTIATAVWAIGEKPLTGWGIGRFAAVNTYHHQQWSPSVPWERGFGIPSHLDVLGILVELGVVGLVLWLVVFTLIIVRLSSAVRHLPSFGMYNRPFAITALLCFVALLTTGLTVDLRFFDFPNIIVMMLVGSAVGWAEHKGADVTEAYPCTTSGSPNYHGRALGLVRR